MGTGASRSKKKKNIQSENANPPANDNQNQNIPFGGDQQQAHLNIGIYIAYFSLKNY